MFLSQIWCEIYLFLKCSCGIEAHIEMLMGSVTPFTDIGRPGNTFAVVGDQSIKFCNSNLVYFWIYLTDCIQSK